MAEEFVEEAREWRGAPATALIAAERTSTSELWRRRARGREGGREGAGAWERVTAPLVSSLGRRGGQRVD